MRQSQNQSTKSEKTGCWAYKAIIINGVDVLLLRHHVPKAPASRVLEGDARRLRTKNAVNIIPIVELIIEPFRDLDSPRRIAILDDD